MNKHPVISVIIPFRNEQQVIGALFARLMPILNNVGMAYEIICINDGSTDDTFARLLEEKEKNDNIRIIDLSRSFGKEAAITSGIDHALGDAVVIMDADLQDPPELIADFVAKWQEGWQVVYGVRQSRNQDSLFKRYTAKAFYFIFNRLSDTSIPQGAGDFRLVDRVVVNALMQLPEQARFMKGIFAWVGFRQTGIPFDRPARPSGESQWPALRLFGLAFDGIFSFSTVPLRLWTWIGAITALMALIYAVFLILRVVIYGIDVPGYASLMVALLFFSGAQLVSMGVLGEYIGRIFTESKSRPLYIINKKVGFADDADS
ncbi:MAG: glycosyltransferase family 2 protein [Rhodospirillaceae bacterium]|nr:glycosyltransferase family 2 protein [Rhodospirillaceae bacterium]